MLTFEIVKRAAKRRNLLFETISFKQEGIRYRYRIDDGNGTTIDCENLVEAYSEILTYPMAI